MSSRPNVVGKSYARTLTIKWDFVRIRNVILANIKNTSMTVILHKWYKVYLVRCYVKHMSEHNCCTDENISVT